jgi:5-methylcytosine-specific restriction endonuclease McrA
MNNRKKIKNILHSEYLNSCNKKLHSDEYLILEEVRKGSDWVDIIVKQEFKCYYCKTDIRIIQKLIINELIGLRKRGLAGYSGLHFELDHKNAEKEDNNPQNLVAACYYCNNDKSNTFSAEVFLNYFGPQRKVAFDKLLKDNEIKDDAFFTHHLSLNKK